MLRLVLIYLDVGKKTLQKHKTGCGNYIRFIIIINKIRVRGC